ncbi:hypothetical protein [Rheinheimera sp.]|uniref:hypothetical protein n=1 Tax=Rheinheimera sp. TaxID=1869214 RepID=UPI0027B99E24|nr:hypothetical protein [Rheinheimera sp.]
MHSSSAKNAYKNHLYSDISHIHAMLMQRLPAQQIQRKNALTPGEKSGILRAQITFSQSLYCHSFYANS